MSSGQQLLCNALLNDMNTRTTGDAKSNAISNCRPSLEKFFFSFSLCFRQIFVEPCESMPTLNNMSAPGVA